MDFRSAFNQINDRFGWASQYLAPGYERLPSSLREEVSQIITDLVVKFMQPTLLEYITMPVKLKDGTTVRGQSAFDRMVREDKDVLAMVEKYRPSYLYYLDRAKRVSRYILWDDQRFATEMGRFLVQNGIDVGHAGYLYLVATVARVRKRIYS